MDIETTRQQLADLPHGEAVKVSRATGLSRAWLSRFATGKIADPSATRLQRLQAHLKTRR